MTLNFNFVSYFVTEMEKPSLKRANGVVYLDVLHLRVMRGHRADQLGVSWVPACERQHT